MKISEINLSNASEVVRDVFSNTRTLFTDIRRKFLNITESGNNILSDMDNMHQFEKEYTAITFSKKFDLIERQVLQLKEYEWPDPTDLSLARDIKRYSDYVEKLRELESRIWQKTQV